MEIQQDSINDALEAVESVESFQPTPMNPVKKSKKLVAAGGRGGGKHSVSKSKKSGLQFPVGRISRYIRKTNPHVRLGATAPVYLASVLEYLSAEVLELAGNEAAKSKKARITPRHITLAVRNDSDLSHLLKDVVIRGGGVLVNREDIVKTKINKKKKKAPAPGSGPKKNAPKKKKAVLKNKNKGKKKEEGKEQ